MVNGVLFDQTAIGVDHVLDEVLGCFGGGRSFNFLREVGRDAVQIDGVDATLFGSLAQQRVADDAVILQVAEGIVRATVTRYRRTNGYIEADLSSASTSNSEIFRVDSFKEKPDVETAERYIRQNNYFWNAGIFIWNVNTIVNAFRIYQPEIAEIFTNLMPYFYTPSEQQEIDTHFPECPNISVDYAILEKSDEIYVFPADFGWSDLGTWGSLHVQMDKDLARNVCIGSDISMYESRGCVVHTVQEKKVVIIGLDGYIVAENNDQLLICKLEDEQRIKEFSDK